MNKNKIKILLLLLFFFIAIILFVIYKPNNTKQTNVKIHEGKKRPNVEKIFPETQLKANTKQNTVNNKLTHSKIDLIKNLPKKSKAVLNRKVSNNILNSLLNYSTRLTQIPSNKLSLSTSFPSEFTGLLKTKRIPVQINSMPNLEGNKKTSFFARQPIKPIIKVLSIGSNDMLSLITSPLNWDSTDFFIYPSLALTTYLFMVEDQPIHNWISHYGTAKEIPIMKFGTIYGQATTTQLSALSVFTFGLIFNNKEAEQIGLEIFESYFIANNITSVLKRIFGRDRPYENNGPYHFDPFPSRDNPINSFPSGHSTLAFSLSSVLAAHTDKLWLKAVIFTPAVITAVSRVYHNVHWFSDVFMGSAIGYLVGNYLVDRHNGNKTDHIHIGFDNYGRFSLQFNF